MAASSWGRVAANGTLASGAVGISAVSRLAAGRYQVSLTTAFATPDYVVVPRFESYSGSAPPYAEIDSRMVGSFVVEWYDSSNVLADQAFTFTVYSGETVTGPAGPSGSDAEVTAANVIRSVTGTPTAGQIPTYTDSTTLTWADDTGGSSTSIDAADIIGTISGTPTSGQVPKYTDASTLTWADDEQGSGGGTEVTELSIIDAIGRPKPGQYLHALSPLDIGWAYPDNRYSFGLFGDNNSPVGVASDDTYLYVVNNNPYRVYVYDHGGTRHQDREFNLHADNADPQGITINSTRIYVSDDTQNKIFVYDYDGGRQRSEEFAAHSDNGSLDGIAISSNRFYIVDRVDDHMYVYDHSGSRQSSEEFDLHTDNDEARGLDVTATHLYVVDQITTNAGTGDRVFVYSIAGVRNTALEFRTSVDNDRSRGIAVTDFHAYLCDISEDSIYTYPLVGSSSGGGTQVEANPSSASSSDTALTAVRIANTNYRIVGGGSGGGGGSTWHTGAGAPMSIAGAADGDYYLRQNDDASDLSRDNRGDVYTYDGSDWTYRFSILGTRGSIWSSGSIDPSTDGFAGRVHDKYIRTTNYDIFNRLIDGSWQKIGNIKGADGAAGPQGDPGPTGPSGAAGSDAAVTAANMISAISGSPSAGQIPTYTDANTLTWASDMTGSGGGGGGTVVMANPSDASDSDTRLTSLEIGTTNYRVAINRSEVYGHLKTILEAASNGGIRIDTFDLSGQISFYVRLVNGQVDVANLDSAVQARLLPALPAEGSRDNLIPKFDGDTLGWEADASGSGGGSGYTETDITVASDNRTISSVTAPTSADEVVFEIYKSGVTSVIWTIRISIETIEAQTDNTTYHYIADTNQPRSTDATANSTHGIGVMRSGTSLTFATNHSSILISRAYWIAYGSGGGGGGGSVTADSIIAAVSGSPVGGALMAYDATNTNLYWTSNVFPLKTDDIGSGFDVANGYIYRVDAVPDDAINVYDFSGTKLASKSFTLHADNSSTTDISVTNNRVYVVDQDAARVYVYDLSGTRQMSEEFDLHSVNQDPNGIAVTSSRVYVLDSEDDRIYVYTLAGVRQMSEEFETSASLPSGLAANSTRIYSLERSGYEVDVYDYSGDEKRFTENFSLSGFDDVTHIALDDDRIYILRSTGIHAYLYNGNEVNSSGIYGASNIIAYEPSIPLYRFAQASSDDPTSATFDILPPSDRGLAELESYSGGRYLMFAHIAGDGPDEDVSRVEFSDDPMKFNQLGAFTQNPNVVQIDNIGYNVWVSNQLLIQPDNVTIEVS